MKKLFAIAILIVVVSFCSFAQQGWVLHKADNHVSVKFPAAPNESTPGTFSVKKNSVGYIFTVVDFARQGIDAKTLAQYQSNPDFAAGLKNGLSRTLPSVNLADLKKGTYKGYVCYSTSGFGPNKKRYDMLMFFIGSTCYSLTTVTANGTPLTGHDKFISSTIITP